MSWKGKGGIYKGEREGVHHVWERKKRSRACVQEKNKIENKMYLQVNLMYKNRERGGLALMAYPCHIDRYMGKSTLLQMSLK